MKTDEIIRKYKIHTENSHKTLEEVREELAQIFIKAPAMNFSAAAKEIGMNDNTIHTRKKQLNAMTDEERAFLIATLTTEKHLANQLEEN